MVRGTSIIPVLESSLMSLKFTLCLSPSSFTSENLTEGNNHNYKDQCTKIFPKMLFLIIRNLNDMFSVIEMVK